MGDGAIVEFASVVEAVRCAVLVQEAMAQRNASLEEPHRISFRIAVHLGDVMVDAEDVYGDGVNVAARLEALATSGGVVVSETVREHVANKLDVAFEDLGPQMLKNIERPVRVHRVLAQPTSVPAAPAPATIGAEPLKPSVAVLPFVNMSGDAEQEYFSDGMSEDLITDLSKISGLFVLARNSTFAYKGKAVDVRELSRKLNVRYVLEGSVRKAGARVRITAQLIDGENGGHVWAERFDRELTDIFAVQDEITQNIVDALKVRLLPAERRALAGQPTADVEAYQHYLRGRQFFHRHDKRSYAIARRLFQRACAIDPLFARALAAIADCDAFLYLHSVSGASPSGILATSARALELQPDLPEAHASRGLALYVHGSFAEAEHEFQTALRLDPNLFETWYFYGRAKFVEGKMAEAAELFERAAEVQPDDFQARPCWRIFTAASTGRPTAVRPPRRRCGGRSGSWSGIPTTRAPPISAAACWPCSARRSGRANGCPSPWRSSPTTSSRCTTSPAATRNSATSTAPSSCWSAPCPVRSRIPRRGCATTAISTRCGSIRGSSSCFAGSKLNPERRARFRVRQRTVADAGRPRLWHFG